MHVTAMHDLEPRHDMYKITSGDSALGKNNGVITSDTGFLAADTNEVNRDGIRLSITDHQRFCDVSFL